MREDKAICGLWLKAPFPTRTNVLVWFAWTPGVVGRGRLSIHTILPAFHSEDGPKLTGFVGIAG